MNDKIVCIISSSDAGKAFTGVAYALNAVKNQWLNDVKLCFFGPAEKILVDNEELQNMINDFKVLNGEVVACKAIADRYAVGDKIAELNINVEFIGKLVSDHIKEGYVPLVW